MSDPAKSWASAGVIIGDHAIGVYGSATMITGVDGAPLVGCMFSLGFLW